jgi:MFS transporter, NNP family, nitrate/nitrite transporter
MGSREPLPPGARSTRASVTLVVAAVGLGLNLRASLLLGPSLRERFSVGPVVFVLLMGLPLLVAAAARLPIGVLTDRHGARVMFPAVSLAAAAAATGVGLAGSLPAVVLAGSLAGVGGAAFVVGGALVTRTFPYGRRGLALGLFGLGVVVAGVVSAMAWRADPEGRRAALVLGATLVGFAALAWRVLRDPVRPRRAGSPARSCLEMVRLASGTSLSLLYALALGGILAIAICLPLYLTTLVGLEWIHALAVTGAVVGLASMSRLVGGWWTDRRPTAGLLVFCYALAAGLCLASALAPKVWWLTVPVIAGVAVCDGVASGALLALIGKAAPPDRAGAIMGMTGAVGAVGALLPPLLVVGAYQLTGSDVLAWKLMALSLLAAALYVRVYGLRVGLGLPVRFDPAPSPTAMTVAMVGESTIRLGAAAVVSCLAELAASDELVVVYGSGGRTRPHLSSRDLVGGLRHRLPRHHVVAVRVAKHSRAYGRAAVRLSEHVDNGALTVAVAAAAELRAVAADLTTYLQADRVLLVSYTPADGAVLRPAWGSAPPTKLRS